MSNLEKVTPGQRIRSLPAGDWNAFVDAARIIQGEQLNQATEGELPEFSPVVVLVKNATGGHLPRYSVLGINGPVADPQSQPDQFRNQIVLVGVAPTSSHCGRFVILKDDLAPGFVGEAVIAGACLAKINVPQGGDDLQFANIAPGNTASLEAKVIGGARILWRESGTGTKWGVVRLADVPQAIVHFQLLGDLVLGGSAPAVILTWDGSTWVPGNTTIAVDDWYANPGMWQAYAGYKGLALKNACHDRYEIVWMETPARSIEFVLTSALAGGQALASVTNYYLQGKSPGSSVTVYDSQGNYPRALAGAKGKARWNDRQRRYEIVECNQMAIALACTLAYDMCSGNEAVRQNFPAHVRDDVVIIPNGSDPGRVYPLVDRNELKASLGLTPDHKVVVYIGRIAVEKNVQALVDAVEHLDEPWHAVIIGPQYVPLERLGPRVHLLPAQRRIGNWLGIADVLCHPSDYESHCFSINEAWLAGVPVVSCEYLVNRRFEERHGPLMWLVPTRPEPARLAAAIVEAFAGSSAPRVRHAREVAAEEYSAPVMGQRWSDLIETVARASVR